MPTRRKKAPAKKATKARAAVPARKKKRKTAKAAPAAKRRRVRVARTVTRTRGGGTARRRAARTRAAPRAARTPAETAQLILDHANVTLATVHSSGNVDDANVRQNIVDTAAGQAAKRSAYGNAPGGTIDLEAPLLDGMLALAADFAFRVSEVAGGSHSATSRHYVGVAFDIDRLQGSPVNAGHPDVPVVKQKLRDLGATEVLGPGDPGHATHLHGAWPRH